MPNALIKRNSILEPAHSLFWERRHDLHRPNVGQSLQSPARRIRQGFDPIFGSVIAIDGDGVEEMKAAGGEPGRVRQCTYA